MKLLIPILLIALSSCATSKPKAIRYFVVTEISGKNFVAVSGKLTCVFLVNGCDSIYVGKQIAVSRANIIK